MHPDPIYIKSMMITPIINPMNAASLKANDIRTQANTSRIGALMIELTETIPLWIS